MTNLRIIEQEIKHKTYFFFCSKFNHHLIQPYMRTKQRERKKETDWLTDVQRERETDIQTDTRRKRERQKDIQTKRETDRQTDKRKGRERQTYRQIGRLTLTDRLNHSNEERERQTDTERDTDSIPCFMFSLLHYHYLKNQVPDILP